MRWYVIGAVLVALGLFVWWPLGLGPDTGGLAPGRGEPAAQSRGEASVQRAAAHALPFAGVAVVLFTFVRRERRRQPPSTSNS